jgi:hypothetical protein
MAIRNTNLGGASNWADGEVLYGTTDLNDTFDATSRVIETDLTGGNSGGTGSYGSYVKIAEVSIPANIISNYVLINILHQSRVEQDGSASMDIRAGETGSVVSKQELTIASQIVGNDTYIRSIFSGNIEYYYEPTSDEKTNGFDIEIYGKGIVQRDVGGDPETDSYCNCIQMTVRGI